MSQITFHIHAETAAVLIAGGSDGDRTLAAISRQAMQVLRICGWHITYAPIVLPKGRGCAMSAHGGLRSLVIEIDRPGTLIAGRGVITAQRFCANKTSPARRR